MMKLTAQKKTGLVSTAITIVVILCLVVTNIVAYVLTEKYPITIDLTSNKAFQLSQESIDYISKLENEIEITVMNSRNSFASGGEYFEQAMSVIEQYEKYNSNITLKFVDLVTNPTWASQYGNLDVDVNDIVVSSGENTEKLTVYDIFNVQQSWYGASITSSNAENAMTGAIMNVVTEDKPVVTFLTGHEESEDSNFESILEKNGFEVKQIMLQTEDVPEDTDIIVSVAPLRDYTEEDIVKLNQFMRQDTESTPVIMYFASSEQSDLPVLEEWLATWGIGVGNGLVAETNSNKLISNNAFYGVADIKDLSYTEHMARTDLPIAFPFSRPVELLFSTNMGYTTSEVLSYSETSGLVDENVQKIEDIVLSGPITVAAQSVYTKDDIQAKLIVFGSDMLTYADFLNSSSLMNMEYMLSCFNTLAQRENVFNIAPKVLGGGSFTLNQGSLLMYTVLLVIVIPVVVLAVGLTVWVRRKRRQ